MPGGDAVTFRDPVSSFRQNREDVRVKWLMHRGIAAAMPDHVALAFRFTRATLEHDPSADQYRSEIIRRWGPRAVMSIAFAILTARMYPTVKYAMGHGKACTRIVVGGAPVSFDKAVAAAHRG